MPTKPMTDKQAAIHAYFLAYTKRHGFSPSTGEIQEKFNITSTGTVAFQLNSMVKSGWMRKVHSRTQRKFDAIEVKGK